MRNQLHKAKSKAKAKPNIKITKEPVEPIKEEEPEPVVEERIKNDKLKKLVSMAVHTCIKIH